MLALRLPKDIEDRLTALARKTGRTKSFYAREAILMYLQDLEDAYQSDVIMTRVASGKEKTYSSDEVRKHLDLDS
jgi:RHH-type rel operon transcriptional repressor/antitoxin RelB